MKKKVFDTYGAFAYFAYTAAGRLASRVWARGVTTAYSYDALGQLAGIGYSDSTPEVTLAYDRMGRVVSAVTAVSSNLFEYAGLDLVGEVQNGAAITRTYDGLGRPAGFNMGSAYIVVYGYDTFGCFASVSSSVASVSSAANYSYVTGSGLVASMTNSAGFWWRRAYEQNRDLIAGVENGFGGNTVSDFAYGNDADGRRERRVDSGSVTNLFTNNGRGEVTEAVMGTGIYAYGYDEIGNRVFSVLNAATNTYAANQLNQYTVVIPSVAVAYDADGNMTRLGDWYHTWDGENRLTRSQPAGIATNGAVMLEYGYNHKNLCVARIKKRLAGRGAGYPMDPSQPGTWEAVETRRYAWDGYNIAAEIVIDEVTPSTNVTYYTWGLDLSGTLQGAGGVGGLLAETRTTASTTNTYYAFGDANGNVTEYADATGAVRGHFEYDAFGEITAQSGDMADSFTHRFSTKPFDVETGLAMYQLRPYSPPLGRGLTRDPIGEGGGLNIYCVGANDIINTVDKLGLKKLSLTYDMQNKSNTSWLERLMMPGNTVWASSMDEALEDIREKVGKYDPDGKNCNCILKLTITGHSGLPGFISFGGANFIDPDRIKNLEEVQRKYADNPVYKAFLKQQSREHDFLAAVASMMCRKEGIIRFAQCQTEHPETRKFLEKIFGDDVTIVLYALNVKWKWGLPTEVPVECCTK